MISDSELNQLFGRHIGLYPFIESNVEGASIFLTASKFAISKKSANSDRKPESESESEFVVKDNRITIPPLSTCYIFTEESISLDSWISGICISRVSLAAKGLILSSTPIKPGWTGHLILGLYNTNNKPFSISVGEKIAVVMFSRLKTRALLTDTRTNRADIVAYTGLNLSESDKDKLKELTEFLVARESSKPKYLMDAMKESSEYLSFKARKEKTADPILVLFLISLMVVILSIIWFEAQKKAGSDTAFQIALLTVSLTTTVTLAMKKWVD